MAGRDHEHEAVFAIRHQVQAEGRRTVGKDADVGAAFEHAQHDLVAVELSELDPDRRIGPGEGGDVDRQELGDGGGIGPQARHPDDAAGVVVQLGGQQVHVAEDALRVPGQRQARRSGRDAARMALEQRGADGGFQVGNPLARRPDRQVGEQRTLADAAGTDDVAEQGQGDEIETVQVHGDMLH